MGERNEILNVAAGLGGQPAATPAVFSPEAANLAASTAPNATAMLLSEKKLGRYIAAKAMDSQATIPTATLTAEIGQLRLAWNLLGYDSPDLNGLHEAGLRKISTGFTRESKRQLDSMSQDLLSVPRDRALSHAQRERLAQATGLLRETMYSFSKSDPEVKVELRTAFAKLLAKPEELGNVNQLATNLINDVARRHATTGMGFDELRDFIKELEPVENFMFPIHRAQTAVAVHSINQATTSALKNGVLSSGDSFTPKANPEYMQYFDRARSFATPAVDVERCRAELDYMYKGPQPSGGFVHDKLLLPISKWWFRKQYNEPALIKPCEVSLYSI